MEETTQLVMAAVRAAAEKKAEDIVAIDVSSRMALTDAFVIASADSQRQVMAIVDSVDEQMHKHGVVAKRKEGTGECHWVLLDYGIIIVHVQMTEDRQYYNLEKLWSDCPYYDLPADLYESASDD